MGKYLKLFETHSQYTAFTQTEDFILPNVSYCKDQTDIVHYNPIVPPQETRLMVTYNVEDASEPTQLYFYMVQQGAPFSIRGVDMFDKVEIDGTEVSVTDLDAAEGMYQLSVDEHTVKYALKHPTSIGYYAFNMCYNLTSVSIPNSVTTIDEGAFYDCTGLTSVTIPNSVTSIGSYAFQDCNSLTSVTIGDSVTSIGQEAFVNCSGLTRVEIDSNTIMSRTYTSKENLKNAFGGQVTEYIIGNSVTSIGEHAFYGCSGLTSVAIGNSVTTIGKRAFVNCFSLTSVTIGNGVTSIGDSAFNGCSGLASVTIPNSVTSIGRSAFYGCSGLTSVAIGNSVTTIGKKAFAYCTSLTNVTIPDSVTSIGNYAFCGCPLDAISKTAIEAINPNATICDEGPQ